MACASGPGSVTATLAFPKKMSQWQQRLSHTVKNDWDFIFEIAELQKQRAFNVCLQGNQCITAKKACRKLRRGCNACSIWLVLVLIGIFCAQQCVWSLIGPPLLVFALLLLLFILFFCFLFLFLKKNCNCGCQSFTVKIWQYDKQH